MNLLAGLGISLGLAAGMASSWLGWQLLRQNGRMLLRLEELEKRLDALEFDEPSGPLGLPLDSPAPDFHLPHLVGKRHSLAEYRGQPLLLIFFNPACGFCRELAPKLAQFAEGAQVPEGRGPRGPNQSPGLRKLEQDQDL